MTSSSFSGTFEAQRLCYFEPLLTQLQLVSALSKEAPAFAYVSATLGNVQVFFEHERGLCYFSVGSAQNSTRLCSVDESAERLPRVRLESGGTQRLSLEEQASLLIAYWSELQQMFSPENLPATLQWKSEQNAAYTARFVRGS